MSHHLHASVFSSFQCLSLSLSLVSYAAKADDLHDFSPYTREPLTAPHLVLIAILLMEECMVILPGVKMLLRFQAGYYYGRKKGKESLWRSLWVYNQPGILVTTYSSISKACNNLYSYIYSTGVVGIRHLLHHDTCSSTAAHRHTVTPCWSLSATTLQKYGCFDNWLVTNAV